MPPERFGGSLPSRKPSISRLPCERCGGPVESDNGWFGTRVAYPLDWGVDLNPHKPKLAKYALCWNCVEPGRLER